MPQLNIDLLYGVYLKETIKTMWHYCRNYYTDNVLIPVLLFSLYSKKGIQK